MHFQIPPFSQLTLYNVKTALGNRKLCLAGQKHCLSVDRRPKRREKDAISNEDVA